MNLMRALNKGMGIENAIACIQDSNAAAWQVAAGHECSGKKQRFDGPPGARTLGPCCGRTMTHSEGWRLGPHRYCFCLALIVIKAWNFRFPKFTGIHGKTIQKLWKWGRMGGGWGKWGNVSIFFFFFEKWWKPNPKMATRGPFIG